MDRKLHDRLSAEFSSQPGLSQAHLEKTVAAAKYAYRSRPEKQRIGFGSFLLRQLRFTEISVILPQALALFLICILLLGTGLLADGGRASWEIPMLLCCCAVLTCMTGLPIWVRSKKYAMYELERSTYASFARLMTARLIITACGNLILMLATGILVNMQVRMELTSIAMYLLFPYLLTSCVCVFVFERVRAEWAAWACIALGTGLVGGFYTLIRFSADSFLQNLPAAGALLCVLFGALLFFELAAMIKRAGGARLVLKMED